MSWSDDRGETAEDKLNAILFQIEHKLNQGQYSACQEIPKATDLIGKPSSLQRWARELRERCIQKGINL